MCMFARVPSITIFAPALLCTQGYIAFANAGQIVDVVAELVALEVHQGQNKHSRIQSFLHPADFSKQLWRVVYRCFSLFLEPTVRFVRKRNKMLSTSNDRLVRMTAAFMCRQTMACNHRWDDQSASPRHVRSVVGLFEEELKEDTSLDADVEASDSQHINVRIC
jgi:hypothetical protein